MLANLLPLLAALMSAQAEERSLAVERIANLGQAAREAAVQLVRAAGDPDEQVSETAVAALEDLGPPPASKANELATLLVDPSADVAYWAATLLGRLQSQAVGAVSPLTAALSDNRPLAVRERAAWALEQIGPAAREALPALREACASKQPRLVRLANEAIAAIER